MSKSTKTKGPTTVESYPQVWEWLCKHNGRCCYQLKYGTNNIEGWRVGNQVVVFILYPDGMGWDLATMLNSNDIAETLADAEARCGITAAGPPCTTCGKPTVRIDQSSSYCKDHP